jgi:hypothetical protein
MTASTALRALAIGAALLSAGCTGEAASDAADRRPVTPATTAGCPNPHGGQCLGALQPGTYTTTVFSPAITFTVPEGWTNLEDLPGNFALQLEDDPRYIGIYRDANAPYRCEEYPDPDVKQTVSDYTRWLRSHPLLHVSEPVQVSLGGLHGVAMDISKRPGAEGKGCTFDEFKGTVPFIIGGRGPASLHHVITDDPGWTERLYLLRYRGGNIAIEIGPEGQSLPDYLELIGPVLRSLRFAR